MKLLLMLFEYGIRGMFVLFALFCFGISFYLLFGFGNRSSSGSNNDNNNDSNDVGMK